LKGLREVPLPPWAGALQLLVGSTGSRLRLYMTALPLGRFVL
jgi:hypothetical protein